MFTDNETVLSVNTIPCEWLIEGHLGGGDDFFFFENPAKLKPKKQPTQYQWCRHERDSFAPLLLASRAPVGIDWSSKTAQ